MSGIHVPDVARIWDDTMLLSGLDISPLHFFFNHKTVVKHEMLAFYI